MPLFARLRDKLHRSSSQELHPSNPSNEQPEAPDSPRAGNSTILGGSVQRFKYKPGVLIGQGSFGEVFTVDRDGVALACKRQSKKFIREHNTHRMVQNEVKVMEHLSDAPNAVHLIEAVETRTDVYLVMELCAGGDVLQSISNQFEKTGLFTERSAATMARHMLGCVLQLHERNVIHRDLKPENFMFYKAPDGKVMLKVCDFGLAEMLEGDKTLTESCGTPNYMAPEMWRKEPYDKKVDVFSMGCCLFVMITGIFPIDGKSMDEIAERACKPVDFDDEWPWGFFSTDLKDLLAGMLEIDPKKRITVAEALAHPWIIEGGTAEDKNLNFNLKAGLRAYLKANAVQKAACQLMAENLTTEELLEVKKRFEAVDVNGDGMISLEEIRKAIVDGVNSWAFVDEKQAEYLFESFDQDHNGYIDLNEYITGVMHIRALHDEERVRCAFNRLDADGDGIITKDEIVAALQKTHQSVYQVPAVMAQIDTDGDGKITYDEFSTFWRKVINVQEKEVLQEEGLMRKQQG